MEWSISDLLDGMEAPGYEMKETSANRAVSTERVKEIAMNRIQNNTSEKHFTLRPLMLAAIAAALAVSAMAAAYWLKPAQASRELFDEPNVAEAFEQQGDTEIQTAKIADYDVAFEGIATGKNLSARPNIRNGKVSADRSYAVFAVSGGKVSELLKENSVTLETLGLSLTPLVQGHAPWEINAWTLGANYSVHGMDGTAYILFETDTLEPFAGEEVCYAVFACKGIGVPSSEQFTVAEDGTFTMNQGVDGVLFTVKQ